MTRVVLLVLDGYPNRHLTVEIAPTLSELARDGGRAIDGGIAVMTSATYPNHASFVTGVDVDGHGIYANDVAGGGERRLADLVGPATPTIFDALKAAGRTSSCVVGDHHLIGAMAAMRADHHWPPNGERPDEGPYDVLGYVADDVTALRIVEAIESGPEFLFAHLNEPDTAGHVFGPDKPRAIDVYSATDGRVAAIVAALEPVWADTVLMVVSDHDMEAALDPEPVDLVALAEAANCRATAVHEGSGAALVHGDRFDTEWLQHSDGVESWRELRPGLVVLNAAEGRWFGAIPIRGLRGVHGGERTRAQLAVVAGGHSAVGAIRDSLQQRRPNAFDWPTTAAALLGVALEHAIGVDLSNVGGG
ncbi:MAG: alkaline phosphatase family protein [Acidimicrobiales bacterium]